MDILDHSDLVFEEMRQQAEICRSSDDEQRVKIDWMDGLVQGLLKLDNLPYAVAKEFPRAWARDASEKAWKFFAKLSSKRSHSSSSDDCLSGKEREDSSNVFKRPRRLSPSKSAASRSSSSDSRASSRSNLSSSDGNDNKASTSSNMEGSRGSNNNREEDLALYLVQALKGLGIPGSKVGPYSKVF